MILPFVRIVILNWPRNSLRGYIEPCRLLGKECQQEVSLEAAPLSGRSNYIWAYFSRHNRAAHQARNYFYPKKMFICSFSFFFSDQILNFSRDFYEVCFSEICMKFCIDALKKNPEKSGLKFPQSGSRSIRDFMRPALRI